MSHNSQYQSISIPPELNVGCRVPVLSANVCEINAHFCLGLPGRVPDNVELRGEGGIQLTMAPLAVERKPRVSGGCPFGPAAVCQALVRSEVGKFLTVVCGLVVRRLGVICDGSRPRRRLLPVPEGPRQTRRGAGPSDLPCRRSSCSSRQSFKPT